MSDLDDIVLENIQVQDAAPSGASFDTGLLVGYHTAWISNRVRTYTQPADLLADGFLVTDPLYLMSKAFCAQANAPSTFKVGRLALVPTQIIKLLPLVTTQGFIYSGTVNGVAWTYTVIAAATATTITTALVALLSALSGTGVTFTSGTTFVTATATVAGTIPSYTYNRGLGVQDITADAGFAADMALIAAEDNAWYGFVIANCSLAYNAAAASYAESNQKIFQPQSADSDLVNPGVVSGDIGSVTLALAYTRMWGIYHQPIGGTEWINAAGLASILSFSPGSAVTAFKTYPGISVDNLNASEKVALTNKKWSRYTRQGGVNIFYQGYTPSGRFIDVTRFVDWLKVTMQLDSYSVLLNNPKVSYEDSGLSMIKGAVLGTLKKGQTAPNNGLALSPAPAVTVPLVANTNVSDRVTRTLNQVVWSARLSGALQNLKISGTLSV
jgi:hypothetical protein